MSRLTLSHAFVLLICVSDAAFAQTTQFGSSAESISQSGSTYEASGTMDGVPYTYTADLDERPSRATVGGRDPSIGGANYDPDRWVVVANRDEMTDVTRWYVHHYQTGLMLGINRTGNLTSVCIVGSDFPGRIGAVRVGDNRAIPISNNCSLAAAPLLQAQLTRGGRLLVGKYEWPYDFRKDTEGSANNFAKIIKLYRWLIVKK